MSTVSYAFFTFPFPPSLNHCWGVVGKRRFLSANYKAFLNDVALVVAGTRLADPTVDGYYVTLRVAPPDRRKRDLDNVVKPVFDALTRCCVWSDDCYVNRLLVERAEPVKNGQVIVHVGAMEPGAMTRDSYQRKYYRKNKATIKEAFDFLNYLKAQDGDNFDFEDAYYKMRDEFPELF